MDRFFKRRFRRANAGIAFVIFIAIVIVILVLLPPTLSPLNTEDCLVGETPEVFEVADMPSAVSFNEDNISLYNIQTHVLVRKNVPVNAKSAKIGEESWVVIDGNKTKAASSILRHTINVGEYVEKPGYDLAIPTKDGGVYTGPDQSGEGLFNRYLLLVKKDPLIIDGQEIFISDVYVRKLIYDQQIVTNSINNIFKCLSGSEVDPGSLYYPEQEKSETRTELQLEYFLLQKYNMLAMHCKPAVYLYPPNTQLVNVRVFPNGTLSYTDPKYDPKTGWNVMANPDGNIFNLSQINFMKDYDYLYFESKIRDEVIDKPNEGWVVKSELKDSNISDSEDSEWFDNQEVLFRDILPKLGLNAAQEKDFIDYWKKALPYSPYYFIGIIDPENVDEIERLEIRPKPDSVNRVRIYFERLEGPRDVSAPVIINNPFKLSKNQFKVVEWGGMVKNDLDHPFTCSQ